MATILREPFKIDQYRRPYHQVDPVPNLLTFFPQQKPFVSAQASDSQQFWRRPPPQDFIWPGTTTQGIPALARDARIFRTPLVVPIFPRPHLQPDPVPNLAATLYKLTAPAPPFVPPLLPEVSIRKTDRDFMVFESLSYLPGPVIAPYIPVDFPTPMRARYTPQDFSFSSTGIQAPAPFKQTDWHQYYRSRQPLQGFEWTGNTTRGIPSGINTPFSQHEWPITVRPASTFHEIPPNTTLRGLPQAFPFSQNEWPMPIRARNFPAESYNSPQILLITPVLKPFAQTDWPELPRRRPMNPISDFYFQAWNTIYHPTVPTGTIAMPNLIGINFYEAIEILQFAGIYIPITFYFQQTSQIKVIWQKSTQYRGGVVIGQSVPAGNLVTPGQPLTLTVASFPFGSLIDLPPDWKQ